MKKVIVLLFVFIGLFSFSQDVNWESYKEIDGIIIQKGNIECNNNELLTFEIENTNSYQVVISWYEEVWVNDVCKQNGQSQEHYREVILNPGETIRGDCTFQESFYIGFNITRGNRILSLTNFDLNNIAVQKAK